MPSTEPNITDGLLTDSLLAEETPEETSSNQQLFIDYTKMTLTLMPTMDNEWNLFPLGIILTRKISSEAAPLITTIIDLAYFTDLSILLPSMLHISKKAGELKNKNKQETLQGQEAIQTSLLYRNSLITSVANWFIITPIFCYSGSILTALGQDKQAAATSQTFLRFFLPFYLFFSPRLLAEFFLVNFGKQVIAMKVSVFSLLLTTIAQYLIGDYFNSKLTALAIASGCGLILTSIAYNFLCKSQLAHLDLFTPFTHPPRRQDYQQALQFLLEAFPVLIVNTTDVIMGFVLAIIAGKLGSGKLEIQNGATQFLNFNYFILAAATQTMIIHVSDYNKKQIPLTEKHEQLKKIIPIGVFSTLTLQLPLAIFITAFPTAFAQLVGSKAIPELQEFFIINSLYALLNGISFNLLQALRTLDDLFTSSLGVFFFSSIGATLSYLFSNKTSLGILGLPTGVTIGASLSIIFLIARFYAVLEKEKKLAQTESIQSSNYIPGSLPNNASTAFSSSTPQYIPVGTSDSNDEKDIESNTHNTGEAKEDSWCRIS